MDASNTTGPSNSNPNGQPPTPPSFRSGAVRQNQTQACAACKYQRRKCKAGCVLNACRLFGISNILMFIRGRDQRERNIIMEYLICQANMQWADPVGGCCTLIFPLLKEKHEELPQISELEARARAEARGHPSVEDQTVLPSAVHHMIPPQNQQQQQQQGQERQPGGHDESQDEELSMQIRAILADNDQMPFDELVEKNQHVI